jgi:hypothetical protein
MQRISPEQKAQIYNQLLFKYERLQEQVRLIKSENINVSDEDQRKINMLESEMRKVYMETEKLYR